MAKHLQVSSSGSLSDGAGGGRLLLRQKKNYSDVLTPTIEARSLSLQERSQVIKQVIPCSPSYSGPKESNFFIHSIYVSFSNSVPPNY